MATPSRRLRSALRLALRLLLGLTLLCAVGAALAWPQAGARLGRSLARLAEHTLGGDVEIGHVAYLFPAGARIEHVAWREQPLGPAVVAFERLTVRLQLRALLTGHVLLRVARLEGPSLALDVCDAVTAKGPCRLLVGERAREKRPSGGSQSPRRADWLWQHLRLEAPHVEVAAARLTWPSANGRKVISGLSLDASVAASAQAGRLDLRAVSGSFGSESPSSGTCQDMGPIEATLVAEGERQGDLVWPLTGLSASLELSARSKAQGGLPLAGVALTELAAHATLQGGTVDLRDLRVSGDAGTLRAAGQFALAGSAEAPGLGPHELVAEGALALPAPWARALPTTWRPAWTGAAAVHLALAGPSGWPLAEASSEGTLQVDLGRAAGRSEAALPAHLEATMRLSRGVLTLKRLRAELGSSLALAARGQASLSGGPVRGHLQVSAPRLAPLIRLAGLASSPIDAHHLRLDVAVAGSVPALRTRVELHAGPLRLRAQGQSVCLGRLKMAGEIVGEAGSVNISLLQPGSNARLLAQATGLLGPRPQGLWQLELTRLPVPAPGFADARVSGVVHGSGSLSRPTVAGSVAVTAAAGTLGQAFVLHAIAEHSARVGGLIASAGHLGEAGLLLADGHWQLPQSSLAAAQAAPTHLRLFGRRLPLRATEAGTLANSGASHQAAFDLALDQGAQGDFQAATSARLPGGFAYGHLRRLARRPGQAGTPRYEGRLKTSLALGPLALLLPKGLEAVRPGGALLVDAEAKGSMEQLALAANVAWQRPTWSGRPLKAGDLVVSARSSGPKSLAIAASASEAGALSARGEGHWQGLTASSWTLGIDALELADFWPWLAAREAGLTLAGELRLRQRQGSGLLGSAHLTTLTLHAHDESLALVEPARLNWHGDQGAADLLLFGSAGELSIAGRLGRSLAGRAAGRIDLGFLQPFVPGLREATGTVGFAATAPPGSTKEAVEGELRIERPLRLAIVGLPNELRLLHGAVTLRGGTLQLAAVTGQLDAGAFDLEGELALPVSEQSRYGLRLKGRHLPLELGPVLAEGDVALHLTGEGSNARLAGDIDIVTGRLVRKFALKDFHLFSPSAPSQVPLRTRAPALKQLQLDLRAHAKNGFDVRVDAGSFAALATLEMNLHVGGNALDPVFNGRIQATDGALNFPHGRLSLSQATIDFDPGRRSRRNALGGEVAVTASGEVTPNRGPGGTESRDITLRLDGTFDQLSLSLSAAQSSMSRLDILAMLTTGVASVGELAGSSDESTKLDAALAVANAQLSGPLTHAAEELLERRLNLQLELGTEVSRDSVRLSAAKNVHRRIRLETAYSHGIAAAQSNVSTRAQLSFTDRLLLEGKAAYDLTGSASSSQTGQPMQNNVALKLRLVGH